MKTFAAAGILAMAALTSSTLSLHAQAAFVNTLMPQPAHLTATSGSLPWTDSITVGVPHFHDQRLDDALARTLEQIERKTGVHRQRTISTSGDSTLVIDVDGAGEAIQSLDENESYTLTATPTKVTLHAATVVGAMRGLTTLLQLVQTDGSTFFVPAVKRRRLAALPLAWSDDRRRPPLRACRRHQAQP